jgi:hypothetical protein
MNDPAQLMSRLRSSFSTTPQPSLKPAAPANTTQGQLDVLDQVLTKIEQNSIESIAQVVPQVALDATDTLNPAQPTTATLKESTTSVSPDISPIESGAGLQQVEYEQSGELPVEVESYLQKVEESQDRALSEVVIADGTTTPSTAHPPVKKPVIVLPITAAEEKAGQKKPLHLSVRWLVEWSKKIMKMFAGEVIYKEVEQA